MKVVIGEDDIAKAKAVFGVSNAARRRQRMFNEEAFDNFVARMTTEETQEALSKLICELTEEQLAEAMQKLIDSGDIAYEELRYLQPKER